MPERKIFRQSALTAYQRGKEKDIVPRLISWPIIVCLWLLLTMFMAAGFLAWYVEVPTYADGSGVILAQEDVHQPAGGETVAVLFLLPDQAARVRVGLPADLGIGSAGAHARGTIKKVAPSIMGPEEVRRSYRLDGASAQLVTQPSVVVIVTLDPTLPAAAYAGSFVTAKVEIGSQRLLALLPGFGEILGSNW